MTEPLLLLSRDCEGAVAAPLHASRAGNTEADSPPNTTTCASPEGDTKASAADAVGVSPH